MATPETIRVAVHGVTYDLLLSPDGASIDVWIEDMDGDRMWIGNGPTKFAALADASATLGTLLDVMKTHAES